jgi:hypothetical protein
VPQDARYLFRQILGVDPQGTELGRHLGPDQLDQLLAGLAASLDEVVHPLLGLPPLHIARTSEIPHDLLGPGTGDLAEHCTGLHVLPKSFIACHTSYRRLDC